MKERGMVFTAESIRALKLGIKTQTRRMVTMPKPRGALAAWHLAHQDKFVVDSIGGRGLKQSDGSPYPNMPCLWNEKTAQIVMCPFGVPGDRIWVKETWCPMLLDDCQGCPDSTPVGQRCKHAYVEYRADSDNKHPGEWPAGEDGAPRWRQPRFMPRWAARTTLELTEVRLQRVGEINHDDAMAEGIEAFDGLRPDMLDGGWATLVYARIWNRLHGDGTFDRNDLVWALTFKQLAVAAVAA